MKSPRSVSKYGKQVPAESRARQSDFIARREDGTVRRVLYKDPADGIA